MSTQDTRRATPMDRTTRVDRTTRQDPRTPAPERRPHLLPLVIVLVALAGGWGLWQAVSPRVAPLAQSSGTRTLAPPIEARTVDGAHFSLTAQRGTVVVVYSMAAWCIACLPEAIALGQVARAARPSGVVTLLVDESPLSDTSVAVRAFQRRTRAPDRSWVIDRSGTIARAYGVAALETTIVIDRAGRVAGRYRTPLDVGALQRAIRRAA